MRRFPVLQSQQRQASRLIMGPWSPEFSTGETSQYVIGGTTGAWASANDPVAIPFRLPETCIVDQLGWMNGTAAGSSIDVGVYDSSWARLVSTGSTIQVGNSVWQFVDVAATTLEALKTYYLAASMNATTANRIRNLAIGASSVALAMLGVKDSATDAFPLPNPLTNMAAAATFTQVPVIAMAMRAPF